MEVDYECSNRVHTNYRLQADNQNTEATRDFEFVSNKFNAYGIGTEIIRKLLPKINNLSARVSHISFPVTYVLRAKKELSIDRSLCEVRAEAEERIDH
jgi:hypothetical protein